MVTSFTVFLSNSLICSVAIILLIFLMRSYTTANKTSIRLVYWLIVVITVKLVFPFEFRFTRTFSSYHLMTSIFSVFNKGEGWLVPLFLTAWVVGAVALIIIALINQWQLNQLLKHFSPTDDPQLLQLSARLAQAKGLVRPVNLVVTDSVPSSFIYGVLRPTIVLTPDAIKSNPTFILSHELEHVKNHHLTIKVFLQFIYYVFWWNPIVYWLLQEAIKLIELHADMGVIAQLEKERRYDYMEYMVQATRYLKDQIGMKPSVLNFSLSEPMVNYRVERLLAMESDVIKRNRRQLKANLIGFTVVGLLGVSPLFITFEPHYPDPDMGFEMREDNAFFIERENGYYEVYADDQYRGVLKRIPEELRHIPVKPMAKENNGGTVHEN